MAGEWPKVTVGEIASSERNSLVGGPFGSNLVSRDYVDSGVPVIRGQNMGERWIGGEFAYVTAEKAASLSANIARPGDVMFTQRGTLGQVAIVPENAAERYVISQSQMKVTINDALADPLFIYYVFRSSEQLDYVLQNAIQTGVPHINLGILRDIRVPLPPINEQRAIAHILSTLDDKIESNRRMNETLEEMARALFKSWFVDFDPVRAKMEGRQPFGMDDETAAFFPDSFEDSPLGEIPKGWSIESIYSAADVIYGAPFSSKLFNEKGVGLPILRIRDLANHSPKVYTPEEHPKRTKVEAGDVAVGMDGEFRAHIWTGPDAWLNQRVCMFVPKENVPAYFVKESLREPLAFFERAKTGTTVIHLGKRDIDTFQLIVPDKSIMEAFAKLAEPITEHMISNVRESRTLAAIRDALLPKLLSGEMRVAEAEKIVEEPV